MLQLITTLLALAGDRARQAARNDDGATAIEWAIFAILALAIAGAVALAINAAITTRTAQIT